MALAAFLETLNDASYGAYVMTPDRRIVFWNRSAQRIVGYDAEEVLGRQCYEVLYGLPEQASVPTCLECLTVRLAESRRMAPVAQVRVRCASGERKRIGVMALSVPLSSEQPTLLVHVFHEQAPLALADRTGGNASAAKGSATGSATFRRRRKRRHGSGSLTSRETEVVRLLAEGEDAGSIARRLHLSEHTVLNHIRNARAKVGAVNRLDLVLKAQRLRLI